MKEGTEKEKFLIECYLNNFLIELILRYINPLDYSKSLLNPQYVRAL